MKFPKKNRFELDMPGSARQNDPNTAKRQRRFRLFLGILFSLFLVFLGGGIFLYLQKSSIFNPYLPQEGGHPFDRVLPENNKTTLPEYRYYMPQISLSPQLKQAARHYQAKELRQASAILEQIISSAAPDKEKAAALIYLGIIAMDRERYELARHHFLRSLRYEPKALEAFVNLAILERRLTNYADAREYAVQARKLAPQDKQVLLLLGNIFFEEQKTENAVSTYKKALRGSPKDALIYYNLGLSHLQKQNMGLAIENFKKAVLHAVETDMVARAEAYLGQLYFEKGNLNLAIDYLKKAALHSPENAKYFYNLGVIYLHKKETKEALEHFKKSLKAPQGSSSVYRSLAQAFLQINEERLGVDALQKAVLINPKDLSALFEMGRLQSKLGYLKQAAESFRKIVNITPGDTNTQDALYKLAQVYADMGRDTAAVGVLKKAVALEAANPRAYFLLGKIYEKEGRSDLSIDYWQKAVRVPAKKKNFILGRNEERRIRLALGRAYNREGNFTLAIEQYKSVQKRNLELPAVKEDPALNLEWAQTYISSQDFSSAISLLTKAAQAKASSPEERKAAFQHLAKVHALHDPSAEGLTQALNYINKALRLEPQDVKTLLEQASLLIQTKTAANHEKALEVLNDLIHSQKDPVFLAKAYNVMGLAYMENKEYSRAVNAFDYALQIDPANKEAYRNHQSAKRAFEQEKKTYE